MAKEESKEKENSYEQKIREEDELRQRLILEAKRDYRNSLIAGLMVFLPLSLFFYFINFKTRELEHFNDEKVKEELRHSKLMNHGPQIKSKRLNF